MLQWFFVKTDLRHWIYELIIQNAELLWVADHLALKNHMCYFYFVIHSSICKVKNVSTRIFNLSRSLWINIKDKSWGITCHFISFQVWFSFHIITTAPCHSPHYLQSKAMHAFITHLGWKITSHLWTSGFYFSFPFMFFPSLLRWGAPFSQGCNLIVLWHV